MPDARWALGAAGERLAAVHLEAKCYQILARNARSRYGELDLIDRCPQGVMVIGEVRTSRGDAAAAFAAAAVDARKQRRVAERAAEYLTEHHPDAQARIDVITVAVDARGHVLGVEHFENAVQA